MSKQITRITLKAYRAFYEESVISLPKGENLLVYGENGSGKSSLYFGLADFFNSSHNIHHHLKADERKTFIKIEFKADDGTVEELTLAKDSIQQPTFVEDTNKLHSFLSYKELLKTYLIEPNQFEEQFFELLVSTILQDHQNPITTNPLKKDWEELKASAQLTDEAEKLDNFNNGVADIFRELNEKLQSLLDCFNHDIHAELIAPTLAVEGQTFSGDAVHFKVDYFGHPDIKHLNILNEARLSALAISVYLASILISRPEPPVEYKILFLDDIFIGLDMSNRIPLLRILKEKFADFQIFLTTYDRTWFELMRDYFEGEHWKAIEMYASMAEIDGNRFEVPLIVDPLKTYFEKAEDYFRIKDYPACANYLRKELERQIKKLLPAAYKTSQNKDFGTTDITRLETLINNLERFFEDCSEPLPAEVQEGIKLYKTLVLNPMSHDDPKSPVYRVEIENTFTVIQQLWNLPHIEKVLLLPVHATITYTNPDLDYTAEAELADNLYVVVKGADKDFARCKYRLKKWTFQSVEWSNMNSTDNKPFPQDQIKNMCEQKRSIEEIYRGICNSLDISENDYAYEEFQVGSRGSLQDLLTEGST
ncbi:hypothetical protein QUF72_00845 [Desulfobacterales bacterium HSG2]|nr:hypothetical protein [Desulfobacterales bacterium HSG2]